MLKLAKHAVATAVVLAAFGAPVAAQAEMPSFSFKQVSVTSKAQVAIAPVAVQPQ
jgi:hypothetical protein